jgi:hypothetical protein
MGGLGTAMVSGAVAGAIGGASADRSTFVRPACPPQIFLSKTLKMHKNY